MFGFSVHLFEDTPRFTCVCSSKMSTRRKSNRKKNKVNYQVLAGFYDSDGESPKAAKIEEDDVGPKTKKEDDSAQSEDTSHGDLIQEIQNDIAKQKLIQKQLTESDRVLELKAELEHLLKTNKELKKKKQKRTDKRQDHRRDMPDLQYVRKNTSLPRDVEKYLREFSLSDDVEEGKDSDATQSDASSSSDVEEGSLIQKQIPPSKSEKLLKGKQSGRNATSSDVVLIPQVWPHSLLNSALTSQKKDEQLSLAEFVAGCVPILQSFKHRNSEFKSMLEHLSSLMYLAVSFDWESVLSFHAAVLLDIERGRASWGDSFAHLEARTLYPKASSKSDSVQVNNKPVLDITRWMRS